MIRRHFFLIILLIALGLTTVSVVANEARADEARSPLPSQAARPSPAAAHKGVPLRAAQAHVHLHPLYGPPSPQHGLYGPTALDQRTAGAVPAATTRAMAGAPPSWPSPAARSHWDVGGHPVYQGEMAGLWQIAATRHIIGWPIAPNFGHSHLPKSETNLLAPTDLAWDDAYGTVVLNQEPAEEDAPAVAPTPASPNQYYAGLIEDHPPSLPKIQIGTVTWLNAADISEKAPQTPIPVATVSVEAADLTMQLSICCRAKSGSTSSQLTFDILLTSQSSQDKIAAVGTPEMRQTGNLRGDALIGAVSQPAPGQFHMLLSQTAVDFDRNIKLLLSRLWIDIPVQFASGRKAVLTFTTGKVGLDSIYAALH